MSSALRQTSVYHCAKSSSREVMASFFLLLLAMFFFAFLKPWVVYYFFISLTLRTDFGGRGRIIAS